jgi:DNA polymerase-1
MSHTLSPHVFIHSNREQLIVPEGGSESDLSYFREHKTTILETLRSTQMDHAGFYKTLPEALLREVRATSWLSLGVTTTASNRFSAAERVSANSMIGTETWMKYRASNPGTRINSWPRIRTLSVHTPALGSCTWDLDTLTAEDKQRLLYAALEEKIVLAHDAGFAMSWIFSETPARPKFVLDTMLLMQQVRPQTLLRPFKSAAIGNDEVQARSRELIEQRKGAPSASREWITASIDLPALDRNFAQPTSWTVSRLSSGHQAYASANVELPLRTVQFLLPGVSIQEAPSVIEHKYSWYIPFAVATLRLAEAHGRGVPFDNDASERLRSDCLSAITIATEELVKIPEFAPFKDQLSNPNAGETSELKDALAHYATSCGVAPPQADSLVPSATSLAGGEVSIESLPAWSLLQSIKEAKDRHRTVIRYRLASLRDGRMHSLIAFNATTGRTTSIAPTLQNIPRDPYFRSLIKARPGHLILSADYSAIELRIAAALADRAIADIRLRLKQGYCGEWFMDLVASGVQEQQPLPWQLEPDKHSIALFERAIPAVAQRVFSRETQKMASIFSRGLDPHLVTALDMSGRQGKFDCGRNPVEWLGSQSREIQKALKSRLQEERTKAKATNFGLLYGMSAEGLYRNGIDVYGLAWPREEASLARQAWFALYPEFRLWQWWTSFAQDRRIPKEKCMVWDSYQQKLITPERDPKLYETSTLSGRPLKILHEKRKALNYQDQGTGADILARAIAELPQVISDMLLMPVHDELVFEVPANEVEVVKQVVVDTMVRAANTVIGNAIPIEVEASVGEAWGKA